VRARRIVGRTAIPPYRRPAVLVVVGGGGGSGSSSRSVTSDVLPYRVLLSKIHVGALKFTDSSSSPTKIAKITDASRDRRFTEGRPSFRRSCRALNRREELALIAATNRMHLTAVWSDGKGEVVVPIKSRSRAFYESCSVVVGRQQQPLPTTAAAAAAAHGAVVVNVNADRFAQMTDDNPTCWYVQRGRRA
jgi:hypothetical protein